MEYGFIGGFCFYITALLGLGGWFYKKSKSTHDYALGGRSLGYWTTAIAAHASDMSIWMFMGLPAAAYMTGIKSIWIPLGLLVGMFITWKIIAQPLRIATETLESETLSTFFEKRFNDTSGILRLLSAFFSLWFFVFYISSGLVGMGELFKSALHVDYLFGVLLGLGITLLYTLLSGFSGIAQSHLFQGIFLVSIMIFIPLLVTASLPSASLLTSFTTHNLFSSYKDFLHSLIIAISWGLGYFGQPHILVNFMSIKNPEALFKAMRIGMLWQFFTQSASVIIGLLAISYFVIPLADAQLVFVSMVQNLFSPFIVGMILCAVVTAGLTTIATQLLVAATTVTNDIYKKYINKKASIKRLLFISQLMIIFISFLSFLIAFSGKSTVFNLVEYAWSGLGGTFGPLVITALYYPQTKTKTVIYALCTSGIISLLWPLFITSYLSIIPAFLLSMFIIIFEKKFKTKRILPI